MSVSQLENTQINSHVLNKETQLEHITVQFRNESIKKKTYMHAHTNEKPQLFLLSLYSE